MPIFGCTNASACNYNPLANSDDGSCTAPQQYFYFGPNTCTGPYAVNTAVCYGTYNCSPGTGTCHGNTPYSSALACQNANCVGTQGCTDPLACNTNAAANCDDGSCFYGFGTVYYGPNCTAGDSCNPDGTGFTNYNDCCNASGNSCN